jgi:GAF domain-containing protein
MVYADRIIGVIELMDKLDGGFFTPADIDTLERFANQAAITIDLSRTREHIVSMLLETFPALGEDSRHQQALDMARDIQTICESGEAELRMCHKLVRDLAEYVRSRP